MAIIDKVAVERRNLSPAALYEHAVRRNEAAVVSTGALATGVIRRLRNLYGATTGAFATILALAVWLAHG